MSAGYPLQSAGVPNVYFRERKDGSRSVAIRVTVRGKKRTRHLPDVEFNSRGLALASQIAQDWKLELKLGSDTGVLPTPIRKAFERARSRASTKSIEYTLTRRQELSVAREAQNRCSVTGHPFDLTAARGRSPFTPSLDRIDSSRGYLPGNVRLVVSIANLAMSTWGEEPLRKISLSYVQKELDQLSRPRLAPHSGLTGKENDPSD